MVVMAVGYRDGVDPGRTAAEYLLTEIRAAVDQEIMTVGLQKGRRAQTIVAWIGRAAYIAGAADLRNAGRRPGAKKCQSPVAHL